MSVYGYIRVSTVEQANDRSSLDDQQRRITGAAMMRGETITRVFSDPGVSGGTPIGRRPGGAELMEALQPGDTVIAAKMDRIFRSAEDALVTAGRLQERQVKLVIADMGPDPVTENGAAKLFFTMLAAFAEFERNRIAERVTDGRRAKSRAGGFVGGLPPYGFRVVGSGRDAKLVQDEGEQETIKRARELRAQGLPVSEVAVALAEEGYFSRNGDEFMPMQVYRMLQPRKEAV
jgi:DNA invertase Pin-like site-specific DNA recombinase